MGNFKGTQNSLGDFKVVGIFHNTSEGEERKLIFWFSVII